MTHQFDMPDVPPPDDLEDETSLRKRMAKNLPQEYREMFTRERPIEVRPIEPYDFFNPDQTRALSKRLDASARCIA